MKICLRELGIIRQAEIEVADLTIICGQNNSGKTYAVYALYGFLHLRDHYLHARVSADDCRQLRELGVLKLDLRTFAARAQEILDEGCKDYSQNLRRVFAAQERLFEGAVFTVTIDPAEISFSQPHERRRGSTKRELFIISKPENSAEMEVSLLKDVGAADIPIQVMQQEIDAAIIDIIFGRLLPSPFIASAERTGAAIFRKELDFARNRIVEELGTKNGALNPFDMVSKAFESYALPVQQNVDFTRRLEEISKNDSFLTKRTDPILKDFTDLIGGDYRISRGTIYFVPSADARVKLTMDESSSAVRSLLDIGFYLRHVAVPGDILMIDEPELNLHPANQRRVARLLAKLTTYGIKVFITTHSDYIVKEINTLIMLRKAGPAAQTLRDKFGYRDDDQMDPAAVRVYIAEEALIPIDGLKKKTKAHTLVAAHIDPSHGIEARSFDTTINEMNEIQEALLYGEQP